MIGGRIELGRVGGCADVVVLRLFGDRRRSPQKTELPNSRRCMTSSAWSVTASTPACPACLCRWPAGGGDGKAPVLESALPDGPWGQGSVVLTLPRTGG